MVVRSTEQWQALFKQHDESGLKASEFCQVNKLCPRYFSKRKHDLGWNVKETEVASKKPNLVKVKKVKSPTPSCDGQITFKLKGVSIDIPAPQPLQCVADLTKALSV